MTAIDTFEKITRLAGRFTQEGLTPEGEQHPFEERNIHEAIPAKVRKLFDDAHYAQATFEAAKFLDKFISKSSGLKKSGAPLMQEAFKEAAPAIALTAMATQSEIDEQKGYQWIFTGSVWAIRNPRGHEFDVQDDMNLCLDHLSFFSMLMRRLQQAGLQF
jgi:uncharacterized protein (TIGR02391 family)